MFGLPSLEVGGRSDLARGWGGYGAPLYIYVTAEPVRATPRRLSRREGRARVFLPPILFCPVHFSEARMGRWPYK